MKELDEKDERDDNIHIEIVRENDDEIDNELEDDGDKRRFAEDPKGKYEFINNVVKDYKPSHRINMQTTPPPQIYTSMIQHFMSFSDLFPEFKDEITDLTREILQIDIGTVNDKKVTYHLPGLEGVSDYFTEINSPKLKEDMDAFRAKYLDFLGRITAKYTDPNSIEYRLINTIKRYSDQLEDPNYFDNITAFPEYHRAMKASFADMPDPNFLESVDEKGKKTYKKDTKRYTKFMNTHVFLDQVEETQAFFINSVVPFMDKSRKGTITRGEAVDFNNAYLAHLIKQKKYFEEILSYDFDDPDIAANKMCNNTSQFNIDWKGPRYGQTSLETINKNLAALERGWPAADLPFLNHLDSIINRINVAVNDPKGYNQAERAAAKQIQDLIKQPYENIMKQAVNTPEERMALLEGLEESLKKYADFDNAHHKRTYNTKTNKAADSSIIWTFNAAKGRMVFRAEVGKNKATEEAISATSYYDINGNLFHYISTLSDSQKDKLLKLPGFMDIYERTNDTYDEDEVIPTLTDRAFIPRFYSVLKFSKNSNASIPVDVVRDHAEYEKYKQTLAEVADALDTFNSEDISNDEIGVKIKDLFKYNNIEKLRLAAKGYSESYLEYKTPFGGTAAAMHGLVDATTASDFLRNNIKKWGSKFPIYDVVIENGKELGMFADYFEEKKKSGGSLSTEREEYYRQKIYDQTVRLGALYSRACATAESPEANIAAREDKVLMEDIFHFHPLSSRGTKALYSSIETYKTGLENGWSLEDIPTLTAFHMMLNIIDTAAKYTPGTTVSAVKKKEPPTFKNEAEKNTYDKMSALYTEIKATPLANSAQRDRFMNKMSEIVREGITTGALTDSDKKPLAPAAYFLQTERQLFTRNLAIVEGKQYSAYQRVKSGPERNIESLLCDLNTRRTDLWFSSENSEHKKLRESVEDLQKFVKENPMDAVLDTEMLFDRTEKYLSKLDTAQKYSRKYREKRAKASTLGGKARLKGARAIDDFAEVEKQNIIDMMKAKTGIEFTSINDIRTHIAADRKTRALTDILAMEKMPSTPAEQKLLISLAADIMIGRIVSAPNSPGYATFNEMGSEAFKKEVMKSSEFKSLMKTYLKDRTMTPEKMAGELAGDGVLAKVKDFRKDMSKSEAAARRTAARNNEKENAAAAKRISNAEARENAFKEQQKAEREARLRAREAKKKGLGKK